jgi:uncharacterized phiE125 gp8 family phage protein
MTFLNVVSSASQQPISLTDAKAHLRVDGDDENSLISSLIDAAVSAVEEETGRALAAQTWAYSTTISTGCLHLPLSPVTSVSSITYYDTDDVEQSLTVSDFYLLKDNDSAYLEPKDGTVWPTTKSRADALTVTFVTGYLSIPPGLRQAVLLLLAHWFENREAAGKKLENLPLAYDYLTSQHKLGWVA